MAATFDEVLIDQLARATRFIQRKSKLKAIDFLKALMFIYHQGKERSLLDLCGDLYHNAGLHMRKQSIQARFNEKAVAFLKAVLSHLLIAEIPAIEATHTLTSFGRVRVKDSTRFALPSAYAKVYKGHGGATHNSHSMISIQYEYDLLSCETLDLRLTPGTKNDQQDAREYTHDIRKNDLFLRDLGYATLCYLLQIIKKGAFFLNRLNPQTTVYYADDPGKEVDFKACYRHMKKHNLLYLEYEVLLGKKKEVRCRLVLSLADEATYQKRLRKTTKQAKSCGHQVSDAFKARARLNLYITNAGEERIPTSAIKQVYGLRWQIELIFKIWKSQAKVHRVKEMKIHRFECQLLAQLTWLMLHWKLFKYVAYWLNVSTPGKTGSVWKYYKYAYTINASTRQALNAPDKLKKLLLMLRERAKPYFVLEKRKRKITHYESIRLLN